MAGDRQGAARKAQESVAVSSGDSSAANPEPALGSNRSLPDAQDVTQPGVAHTQVPADARNPLAALHDSADAATIAAVSTPASSVPHPIFNHIGATVFHAGDVLGGRFEIQKLLGMGGMGAVYKARDMEVDRVVGLKVIRPDLAGNAAILARFKQELVLARQITHKNIIRIYDLNEADGVKFITMEFVEGEDLRTILTRQGKLSPEQAVGIILQVCTGLQAAHQEGVIHRDLKPSNIMLDHAGRVVIMDFGLARTVQGDGMTQTGMMIGTMEYMSPEQAMGKELDASSDQFAVGLIFYELLSGFIPFHAESAIASLVKRTQERAVPLIDVDSAIPPALSNIVAKCLERDPAARFASVQELIDELEIWQGKKPGVSQLPARPQSAAPPKRFSPKWIMASAGLLVLAIVAGIVVHYRIANSSGGVSATQGPVASLAVIPFYNSSGDPSLNWIGSSLSETLSSDIGQSAHLRSVSPARLQQVLHDLGFSPQSQPDVSTLKRVAEYTNSDNVIYGQYQKFGEQIRINTTILDLKQDRRMEIQTDVPSEKNLLSSLDQLAEQVREKLASSPEMLRDLQAHSQRVSTSSIPALRAYEEGTTLARSGDSLQAVTKFEEATAQDPNFAMAFASLAQTYASLGFDEKAEQASRRAVALSDNLSARDRYLIEAVHASLIHDTSKAIAAYENLTKLNPDDTDAQFALAKLYEDANNFPEAQKRLTKVIAADPKYVAGLLATGRVDIKAGNPQAALDPLNNALSLAIQFDNQEQKGKILQALGIAYQHLGKSEDALRSFQQALDIRKKIGDQSGTAASLSQMAQVQDAMGDAKAALASYTEAVAVQQKIGDKHGLTQSLISLGSFYLDHGKYDDALKYTNQALQIARDSGDELSQATCLNNIGNAHFNKGEYQDALTYFQQAYQIRDRLKLQDDALAALHNLAYTNVKLGQYETALSQYMKALEAYRASGDKAGVALESSDMGALFAAQGRYGAALNAQQEAVKAYQQLNDRTFLMMSALAGYGHTLSAAGREQEGHTYLQNALAIASEVKNDATNADALNFLGDSYFYSGDYNAARQQYERGLQLAKKSNLHEQSVLSRLGLAKLDVIQGHPQAAAGVLQKLIQEADNMGLKAQSVQASIYLGEALLASNRIPQAQQELDGALGRAESLGLRVEEARAHYLLGNADVRSGKAAEAVPQYRETVKILESISKEDGVSRVLERADLKDMYHDAAKAYQGGK